MPNAVAVHSPAHVILEERWYVVGSLRPRHGQANEAFFVELASLCPDVSFKTEQYPVDGRPTQRLFVDRRAHVHRDDAEAAWRQLSQAWAMKTGNPPNLAVGVT